MSTDRSVPLPDVLARLREKIQEDIPPADEPDGVTCHWCHQACGGTCLGVTGAKQMAPSDPAYWMLKDGCTTSTKVYDDKCYICRDPEFAQMGLPLCRECPDCKERSGGKELGHIPADDVGCTVCGSDREYAEYMASLEDKKG